MELSVLQYPDPRLRNQAKHVVRFDPSLKALAEAMLQTMYDSEGIGLASTQVNREEALIVLDISSDRTAPMILVNPSIKALSTEPKLLNQEGCLSLPGVYALVPREAKVLVSAQNLQGRAVSFEADGLLAICIQHELDHLQGKLFVDYLSPLKQALLFKKLKKRARAR